MQKKPLYRPIIIQLIEHLDELILHFGPTRTYILLIFSQVPVALLAYAFSRAWH